MAAPCVNIFIDGNEAKTNARDLKVLQMQIFLSLPHPPRRSQIFDTIKIWIHKKIPLLINPKGPFYLSVQWRER